MSDLNKDDIIKDAEGLLRDPVERAYHLSRMHRQQKVEEKFPALFEGNFPDGMWLQIWQGEDLVFVTLDFLTFTLPPCMFVDFAEVICLVKQKMLALKENDTERLKEIEQFFQKREKAIEEISEGENGLQDQ